MGVVLGFLGRFFQVLVLNKYFLFFGFFFVGVNMGIRQFNFFVLLSEEVGEKFRYYVFLISFGFGMIFNVIGVFIVGFVLDFLIEIFGFIFEIVYCLVILFVFFQFVLVILVLFVIYDVFVKNLRINWNWELVIKIFKFFLLSVFIGFGVGIMIFYMSLYFNICFGQILVVISGVFFFQQFVMGFGFFGFLKLVEKIGFVNVIMFFQFVVVLFFVIFLLIDVFFLVVFFYIVCFIFMNIVWLINDFFMMGFFMIEEKVIVVGIRRVFLIFMCGVGNYIGGVFFLILFSYLFYVIVMLYVVVMLIFYGFFVRYNRV